MEKKPLDYIKSYVEEDVDFNLMHVQDRKKEILSHVGFILELFIENAEFSKSLNLAQHSKKRIEDDLDNLNFLAIDTVRQMEKDFLMRFNKKIHLHQTIKCFDLISDIINANDRQGLSKVMDYARQLQTSAYRSEEHDEAILKETSRPVPKEVYQRLSIGIFDVVQEFTSSLEKLLSQEGYNVSKYDNWERIKEFRENQNIFDIALVHNSYGNYRWIDTEDIVKELRGINENIFIISYSGIDEKIRGSNAHIVKSESKKKFEERMLEKIKGYKKY